MVQVKLRQYVLGLLMIVTIPSCLREKGPTETFVKEQIQSDYKKSERYLVTRSFKEGEIVLQAIIDKKSRKGKLADSIVNVVLTDGVLKNAETVPTYTSSFSATWKWVRNNEVVDTSTIRGEAIFEKREKGWHLLSIN